MEFRIADTFTEISSFDPLEIEMLALSASRVPGLSLKALAKTY